MIFLSVISYVIEWGGFLCDDDNDYDDESDLSIQP